MDLNKADLGINDIFKSKFAVDENTEGKGEGSTKKTGGMGDSKSKVDRKRPGEGTRAEGMHGNEQLTDDGMQPGKAGAGDIEGTHHNRGNQKGGGMMGKGDDEENDVEKGDEDEDMDKAVLFGAGGRSAGGGGGRSLHVATHQCSTCGSKAAASSVPGAKRIKSGVCGLNGCGGKMKPMGVGKGGGDVEKGGMEGGWTFTYEMHGCTDEQMAKDMAAGLGVQVQAPLDKRPRR